MKEYKIIRLTYASIMGEVVAIRGKRIFVTTPPKRGRPTKSKGKYIQLIAYIEPR